MFRKPYTLNPISEQFIFWGNKISEEKNADLKLNRLGAVFLSNSALAAAIQFPKKPL